MGYYDGNTVTALWNYAQHFAKSDNFYQTNFGESIPGHLNLILVRHMEQFQLLIQRDILLMGQ